jgi:hypothetical protein
MAYHIFVSDGISYNNRFMDEYLGSAVSVDFYWESAGRILNLPIISNITERADSEDGFVLRDKEIIAFKNEIDVLERYWINESSKRPLPNDFLTRIRIIKEGVSKAIADGLTLMIG